MLISILTLFPSLFPAVVTSSIIGRAQKKGLVEIRTINIRSFAVDSYGTVDDKPYGGGVGMVLRVDVVHQAIQYAVSSLPTQAGHQSAASRIILLDPAGKQFRQPTARRYAKLDHLILICGHYEGVDARIHHFIDERLSIGPYVLTGGEIPAMVVADSVIRLIPGVLSPDATAFESHSVHYTHEPPHYTRPANYQGFTVPEVLTAGDPAKIRAWISSFQHTKQPEKKQ